MPASMTVQLLMGLPGCLLVALLWKYFWASRRPANFPPGPPTRPFLGNLHQLPQSQAFLKFHEWSQTYGSIVGLKLGPQNVVILNGWKPVRDLLDKRGAIYSSRPDNHVGNDLICPDETHILLAPYGPGWRILRKTVQALLNVRAVDAMFPIQNAEASQTMHQLLHDPEGYYDHIRRYSTAVILSSVFGQRGKDFNSPKVRALYHAQEQFTSILAPGATPPVDAFPWLRYLPKSLAGWKEKAQTIRAEQRELYFSLMEETKARVANGAVTGCFMEEVLKDQEKAGLDDEHVAYLGGILMEAGSDTTASTLLSYLLGIISNPAALETARNELDGVCGTERSPTFDDLDKLPYLRACMIETLRWRPVAPGGIPHLLIQDDHYEGYHLPKGTIVFANAWSIHREQEEYSAGDDFRPERFLNNQFGAQGAEDQANDHRRATYSFGAGRRVCPGQRLAENLLMLNMAKITWGFDISGDRREIDWDVKTGYTDGFVFSPKRFPVNITARSDVHRDIFEREFEAQRVVLEKYGD
ncbi:hypothetical protein FE257_004256 [Aspergillus nanangensis]|uniref:Cytochrome P450 n=1 Tax=Aspergillus nanangensis TaxID=2582783 RepID=A0AAD4GW77_ASPNN|nr:hypothetical protein FE257_004256 [Aspergillus nanangensis]